MFHRNGSILAYSMQIVTHASFIHHPTSNSSHPRALLYSEPLLSQPKPLYDHPYYVVRPYVKVLETVPAAKDFIRDHCIKKYGHEKLRNFSCTIDKIYL
jgi:hypothetical protein